MLICGFLHYQLWCSSHIHPRTSGRHGIAPVFHLPKSNSRVDFGAVLKGTCMQRLFPQPDVRCATAAANSLDAFLRTSGPMIDCTRCHRKARFAASVNATRTCCKDENYIRFTVEEKTHDSVTCYDAFPFAVGQGKNARQCCQLRRISCSVTRRCDECNGVE